MLLRKRCDYRGLLLSVFTM